METQLCTQLGRQLDEFRVRFNENVRVKKLIKNWNRSVAIDAVDINESYSLVIEDLRISDIVVGMVQSDPPIHLQAEQKVFLRMFSGEITPASALMDGSLAVFSTDRDKVKLEAIAMVIWGL